MNFIKGNILDFTEDAVGHGCNCQSVMGAGVARAIREKYPQVYEIDCNDERNPKEKLGKFSIADLDNKKKCYNIYSQYDCGGRNYGEIDLDYDALKSGLELVFKDMNDKSLKSIALPLIGAGLAGGDWNLIEPIIDDLSKKYNIKVVIYYIGGHFDFSDRK